MSKISDQNILLRAQLTAAASSSTGGQQNGFSDQSARVSDLEHQIMSLMNEKTHHDTRISFYEAENARLLTEIEQFKKINGELDKLKSEKSEHDSKVEKMNKDQEDLLELLADQDNKLREYKKRLKTLGQPVSDDEED
jgi:chromosome segregation ATPase